MELQKFLLDGSLDEMLDALLDEIRAQKYTSPLAYLS